MYFRETERHAETKPTSMEEQLKKFLQDGEEVI
jgi:hypothetical protein